MNVSAPYSVTVPAGLGPLGFSLNEVESPQHRIEIGKVEPTGRAAVCKIIPHSAIVALNGVDTTSHNMAALLLTLKSFAGQALTLSLEPPELWKAASVSSPSKAPPPPHSPAPSPQAVDDDDAEEDKEDEENDENDGGEAVDDLGQQQQTPALKAAPSDWGNDLHHQFQPVSNQVENGLHALKRVLQHIEKVTSLHSSLAKARKTAAVVKALEAEVETSNFFAEAYAFGQNLNLHATECLYAFSMAVTEQITNPGMKFYQQGIDLKRELDKQMKKRDELYQKLSVASRKDLAVCKNDLALLITASEEKKAVEGKKFTELTVEQQKTYNKLDANKSRAQGKVLKQLKEYHANFIKARQAQEDRMHYVRYALNVLRNLERERMETSAIYLYRLDELYSTLILDLQKLSLADKLGNLDATKAIENCKEMWQQAFGPPPEDVLLEYGLPCSPEEAERDIFKSSFGEEMTKAKYSKEEYKDPGSEPMTGSGRLLEGYASALAASKTHTTEKYDPVRDELSLRQKVEIVNLLRKNGNNLPFLEQTHLSQNITRINERGKKDSRILLLTDKAIYSLGEKFGLHRRIGYEQIKAITVSNHSNELKIHAKKGADFHLAAEKKQVIADALHIFLPQFYRPFPELDEQFKKSQFFFYVDVQNLLRYKPDENMEIPSVSITPTDEASLTYTGGSSGVHVRDFKASGLLGQGTFGRVLLVTKNDDFKQYAMKILNKKFLVTNDQVKNVKNEQQILTRIDHPFIVRAHYTFTGHERIYMVLDYAGGGELFNHVKKLGKFSEDAARFITAEIGLALGHLHSKNIIYRDLKPENVLLDESGHIKITDFGTSKTLEAGSRTHTFCGTPQYLSPEVVAGYGHDKAVDWWALGILLYELVVGVAPFSDDNVKKLHEKIQNGVLKFPSSMSPACKDVIVSLLNRSAKHRLGSVDDVGDLKKHEFFKGIDWDKLLKKEVAPPFVPTPIKPAPLTKAQQKEFRDEQSNSVLTLVPGFKTRANKKQAEIDANFRGFTWAANSMEEFAANSAKSPRRPGDTESVLDALEEEEEKEAAEKEKASTLKNKISSEPKKAPPPPAGGGTLKLSDKAQADSIVAAEKAATEKAVIEKALADKVAAEKAAVEQAAIEKAAVEKAAAEKIAAEKAATEKIAAEKAAAERIAVEKAAAEKAAAEKAAAEKAAAEQAAAEKAAAEKAAAEKAAADKLAAQKAAQEAIELAAAEEEIKAAEMALVAAQAKKMASLPLWEVTHKGGLRVRAEPSKDGAEAGTLSFGQRVGVMGQQGDWIQHSTGWCLTKTPGGKALMEPVT